MKIGYILVVILLVSSVSFALSISGTDDTVSVKAGDSKTVSISVSDSGSSIVSMGIIDPKPWVSLSQANLNIENGTVTTGFIVSPYIDTTPSTYRFGIVASSPEAGIVKKDVFIRVLKGETIDIDSIKTTGNLVPKGEVELRTKLKSTMSVAMNNIIVNTKITSPSGQVSQLSQIVPSLDPDGSETVVQTLSLPARADEGDYGITVAISYNDAVRTKESSFTVARKAIIVENAGRFSLLFGYGKKIIISNEGNFVQDIYDVQQDISPFDAMFISGDAPLAKNDGKYTWRFSSINPGDQKSAVYFIDYSPLFIIIVALIIAIWAILFKLRSVRIRKYIIQKKFIEEGEEFSVGIDVKNGVGKKIDEIIVTDFVPSVFEYRHEHGPAPKKKKSHMGIELTWVMKDLYPGEERVLSYKITPVFGIHGQLSLPPAKASLKHNNIRIELKSFAPRLGMVVNEEGDKEEKKHLFRKHKKEEFK